MFRTKEAKIIYKGLTAGSVTTDKIADGAVTQDKLATHVYQHIINIPIKNVCMTLINNDAEAYTTLADLPDFDYNIPVSGGKMKTTTGQTVTFYFLIYTSATKSENGFYVNAVPTVGTGYVMDFFELTTAVEDTVIQLM